MIANPRMNKTKLETPTAIPTFAPVERPFSEGITNLGKLVEVIAVAAVVLDELVLEVFAELEGRAVVSEPVSGAENVSVDVPTLKMPVVVAAAGGSVTDCAGAAVDGGSSIKPEDEASAEACRIENFPDRARILRVGFRGSESMIR